MNRIMENFINSKPNISFLSTGIKKLDDVILGYQKGELITIASRPSFGKTALILESVLQLIEQNKKVLYFVMNETSVEIISKLVCKKHNLDLKEFLMGDYQGITKEDLQATLEMIDKYLVIKENTFIDIGSIETTIKCQNENSDLDLIVIDSLSYIVDLKDIDKIDNIKELKSIAISLRLPIVLLSLIDVKVEDKVDKRPMLSDIKNYHSIVEYSDKILILYRDEYYKYSRELKKEQESLDRFDEPPYKSAFIDKPIEELEINIAKNRFGNISTLKALLYKSYYKIYDNSDNKFSDKELHLVEIDIPDF